MARGVRLARLLRRAEPAAVLAAVAAGRDAVTDVSGRRLAGPDGDIEGPAVTVAAPDGTPVGEVRGPGAAATASALTALVGLEQERRELADEALEMYREVNLLYALGELLATASDRDELAALALREATRNVPVDAAFVVVEAPGDERHVAASTPGADRDDLPDDLGALRIEPTGSGAGSVLVAPLAFRGTRRGAVVLVRHDRAFAAGDLKLTGAVAAQCVGVLERVVDEERRAAAAAAREAVLQRQLDQLRIELDQERQTEQVAKVTDSEYFGGLRAQASDLRRIIGERNR